MAEITTPSKAKDVPAANTAPGSGNGRTPVEVSAPKHGRIPVKPVNRVARVPRAKGRGRRPGRKPYPVMTFEQALVLGQGIMQHGAGHPVKRKTLLSTLGLGDSQPTRNLITISARYGITSGSYKSDELRLTESGRKAVDPAVRSADRMNARFELSIALVPAFKKLYDNLKGGKVPALDVMRDMLDEVDPGDRPACVDVFIANAKFIGILTTREGATCLDRVEDLSPNAAPPIGGASTDLAASEGQSGHPRTTSVNYDQICFFVSPIGEEGSDERRHSDAILSAFIEPALREHKLIVVRADKITAPGMISGQVIEHIVRSRLVVADLSFHNPNVFYELALRHVTGKPTVHIIRETDKIPFDVQNFRTVQLPTAEVYGMLAKLQTCQSETAQQIRQALADGVTSANPVRAFHPKAKFDVSLE